MKNGILRATVFVAIFALVCGVGESAEAAGAVPGLPRYAIRVELDPEKHFIKGIAEMVLADATNEISFTLRKGLKITRLTVNGKVVKAPVPIATDDSIKVTYRVTVPGAKSRAHPRLGVSYEGEIFDAVTNPEKGTFVIGERTTGVISERGIYVDESSGWYPKPADGLALYTVEAVVPEGWVAVAAGDTVESTVSPGRSIYRFASDVPFDGMVLVAGKYTVTERKKGSIRIRAVFFPEEQPLADLFLNHLESYLDKYENLFGFYPYQRFDIVENFFTTGYSFPTFTLLGKDVIKMGERALQPGYLDHELVHSWFGNYLYFKPGTGNWVEGLTTYFANYYAREQEGPEAARAYRFGQMLRYSVRVAPANDYPLRRFEGKEEDFENDIGYGKASMFFHLLRRMMGEDVFLIMVRDMVHHYGGKMVDWEDFRKEMEPILRADLQRYFADWLDEPGIPELRLETPRVEPDGAGGYVLSGKVAQAGHLYSLNIPVRVYFREGGFVDRAVWIDGAETPFRLNVDRMPERVGLDPDYHIMRRIPRGEGPASLNAALASGSLLVLVPENPGAYQPLVDRLKSQPGVTVENAVAGREMPDRSFLLIGRYDENPLSAAYGPVFREVIEPTPEGVKIGGALYNEPDNAAVVWAKHPLQEGQYGGIYWGNSEEALGRARYLLYYGWDSAVAFKKGSPVYRWTPMEGYRSWDAEVIPEFLPPSEARLRGVAEYLTRPESKGRRAGTPEADEAAGFVARAFVNAGLKPLPEMDTDADYLQPFTMEIVDSVPEASPFTREPSAKRGETLDYWPFISGPEGTYRWSQWVGISGVEDIAEKPLPAGDFAVWMPAEKATGWALADWYSVTDTLRLAGCVAFIIVGRPSEIPGIPTPYFDYPSRPAPWPDVKPARESPRKTHEVEPLMRHARNQASLLMPVQKLSMPILAVSPDEFAAKRIASGRKWRLDLRFWRHTVRTANVVGYLPASEKTADAQWVVIGAHYDHLGTTKEGVILPGAVDNAAGVAAITEVASLLSASPFPRKQRVVFVAFSGEEWGLRGAQAFVDALPENVKVPYMINVDAVAGRDEPGVYLIGGTRFEGLARIAAEWARQQNFTIGKNIDQYALGAGSDFWPFLESGIPVLGVFDANYREMDQPEDNLAAIRFPKLAKIAAFLVSFVYDLSAR
jgi:hypothetical protein